MQTTTNIEMEALVIAGTESAQDSEYANGAKCVCCGASIKNIVVTNIGPVGCDCYATKTGDATMRRAFSGAVRNVERSLCDLLEVKVTDSNKGGFAVLGRVDDDGWKRLMGLCRVDNRGAAEAVAQALRDRYEIAA